MAHCAEMCIRDRAYAESAYQPVCFSTDLDMKLILHDLAAASSPEQYAAAQLRLQGCTVAAVSYTHLDVYKRQLLICWSGLDIKTFESLPNFPIEMPENIPKGVGRVVIRI